MKSETSVKAVIKTDVGTESIWVDLLSGSEEAVVDNIPFEVYGVSLGDVVQVALKDGVYSVVGIVSKSGNLTYRVASRGRSEDFVVLLQKLRDLKCEIETNVSNSIGAISVPRQNSEQVESVLKLGEETGVWEFEEGDVWCKFNKC